MLKKIIALFLVLCMVVPVMVACNNDEDYDRKDREEREDREDDDEDEREDSEDDDDRAPGGLGGLIGSLIGGNKETAVETVYGDDTFYDDAPSDEDTYNDYPYYDEPEYEWNNDGDSADTSGTSEDVEFYDEINEYVDGLASSNNFEGKTFVWIGGGSQIPYADEETGNILSDALYYRQRDIEEKFSISFESYMPEYLENSSNHPVVDAVASDVMAGIGAYDAGYGTSVSVCLPLLNYKAVADINTLSGIDFDREWWTSSLTDTYHFAGKLYFVNGSIVTSNYTDASCVLFNKNIQSDYEIEDLYSLVENGEWTFDKMLEVSSVIPANTNGSGAYRFSSPNGMAVIYANGYTVTKFNDDQNPYVEENLPIELSNLSDKFAPIFGDDNLTVNIKGMINSQYENFNDKYGYNGSSEMFADDNSLFHFTITGDAQYLRGEDVNFGILPMPKESSAQGRYITYAEPWSTFDVFVPKTTKDADVTGIILETMAALGEKYIKPAYYDSILRGHSSFDYESLDMLDIIIEGKVYDIIDFLAPDGNTNSDSSFVKTLKGSIQETNQGIASKYKMMAKLVNRNIETNILPNITE